MKKKFLPQVLVPFVLLCLFIFPCQSDAQSCSAGQRTFTFTNNCGVPLYVGAFQSNGVAQPSWKWKVDAAATQTYCVNEPWVSGRFWARVGCQFDSGTVNYPTCAQTSDCAQQAQGAVCYNGVCTLSGPAPAQPSPLTNNQCATWFGIAQGDTRVQAYYPGSGTTAYCILNPACDMGDCRGALNCTISGNNPSTLAEFTLATAGGATNDNYDDSSVNGAGIPTSITPIEGTFVGCAKLGCTDAGAGCTTPCVWNANLTCQPELRKYSNGVVVGCMSPTDYCSLNLTCKSGGAACAANTDCCSGTCASGTCAAGSSLNCWDIHSTGQLSCTAETVATDCPTVSAGICSTEDASTCPTGTTCRTVNQEKLCIMDCVSGNCKSPACTTDADCATWNGTTGHTKFLGQGLRCDLEASSPTYQTCQSTSYSYYGCVGIQHTSCKGTGTYGAKATWCCGCATWQDARGECMAKNPTWQRVAEPFAAVARYACETSYGFAYDDKADAECGGAAGGAFGYNITFCPSPLPSVYPYFAGDGLYKYNGSAWTRITTAQPQNLVAAGTVMYPYFPGDGLYKYDSSTWTKISGTQPASMISAGELMYLYFTGDGLYKYDGTVLTLVTRSQPQSMTAVGSNLYAYFAGDGYYRFNGNTWTLITTVQPQSAVAGGPDLYPYFAGDGLYKFDGNTWTRITTAQPQTSAAAGTTMYFFFAGDGLYKYNGTWAKVTTSQPQSMVGAGTNMYMYFLNDGLYKYDGSTWTLVTTAQPQSMVAAGTTVYLYFVNDGLYKYDGSSWTLITTAQPQSMVPVKMGM